VSIKAGMEDEHLRVDVSDTGPGIPIDERDKIFQPFYRGAHGRRIVQGMGLGLSIARDIVVAHGGAITMDTNPGVGSCITLRIPVNM